MTKRSFQAMMREAEASSALAVEEAKLDFAIALSRLMERGGLSRSDLATRLDVSLPMVTKILRGDANLTIETMVKATRAAAGVLHINIAPEGIQGRWLEVVRNGAPIRAVCGPAVISRPSQSSWNLVNGNEGESVAA